MIEVKALAEHALERAFHLKMDYLDDDSSKDKCESKERGLFHQDRQEGL